MYMYHVYDFFIIIVLALRAVRALQQVYELVADRSRDEQEFYRLPGSGGPWS